MSSTGGALSDKHALPEEGFFDWSEIMSKHYALKDWRTHPFFHNAIPPPLGKETEIGDKFIYVNRSFFLHHSGSHTDKNDDIICPHCQEVVEKKGWNFDLVICTCGKQAAYAGAALYFEDFPYKRDDPCNSRVCVLPEKRKL